MRQDAGIVRNRLKISAAVNNAKAFIDIQKEYGSFDKYIWSFTGERVAFRAESTSKILNMMYSTPDITIQKLAEGVGINVAAVNKQIKQLTTKGYVQRSEKDGSWRLVVTPSI